MYDGSDTLYSHMGDSSCIMLAANAARANQATCGRRLGRGGTYGTNFSDLPSLLISTHAKQISSSLSVLDEVYIIIILEL